MCLLHINYTASSLLMLCQLLFTVFAEKKEKRIDTTEHECKQTYLFAQYLLQWVFKSTNEDTLTVTRQSRRTEMKSQQKVVKPSHWAACGMHSTRSIFFWNQKVMLHSWPSLSFSPARFGVKFLGGTWRLLGPWEATVLVLLPSCKNHYKINWIGPLWDIGFPEPRGNAPNPIPQRSRRGPYQGRAITCTFLPKRVRNTEETAWVL